MSREQMPAATIAGERSRWIGGAGRDIEAVDRYIGKGRIVPDETPGAF